jgi:3-oxocholest-4-en-26-oyl-CoA dehydrogenase beta subunit
MDFALNEEEQTVADLAAKILGDLVTPESYKGTEYWQVKAYQALADAALVGAALPEGFGGGGMSLLSVCALLEKVGWAAAPVPVWSTVMLGAVPVARFGSDEQKQRLLPGVAQGRVRLSAALCENTCDPVTAPTLRARQDGAVWWVDGAKLFVPDAEAAAVILVPVVDERDALGIVMVNPHHVDVRLRKSIATHGEPLYRVEMGPLRIPREDVLVDPVNERRGGRRALEWIADRATVGLCAMAVGAAQRALRLTAEYTTTRQQFDRPIATFQAVAQRAADAAIDLEAMRLTMWQAAFKLARDEPCSMEVALAKLWAAEAGHRVTAAAQHLHGGVGVDCDYPLHRSFLWTRHLGLMLGGASQQLDKLGGLLAAAG